MNSPRTHMLGRCAALLSMGISLLAFATPQANADDTPVITATSQEDAPKFLRAALMQGVYKTPLDLKVEGLTANEIVERVQKTLAARKPSVVARIEVRDVLPVRLSIGVKGSTVGRVLNSAAILAGARVWIFEDYALLAPEMALTPEERNNLKNGFGSSWPLLIPTGRRTLDRLKHKAFSSFIVDEVNRALAQGAGIAPTNIPLSTDAATNGIIAKQLSPAAQAMLQELVNDKNQSITNSINEMNTRSTGGETYSFTPLEFSLDTIARFSTDQEGMLRLDFPTPGQNMKWLLNGNDGAFSAGFRPRQPAAPKSSLLPLDLSAGKS
ncbi:hypothetical protein EON83_22765 [bacterium]|nr:MAG: hypothetical protein EON83_22765 [bacterium]